jgi:hypothetical protein
VRASVSIMAIVIASVISPMCAIAEQPVATSGTASLAAAAEARESVGDARHAIPIRLKLDGVYSRLHKGPSKSNPIQSDNAVNLGFDYFQQDELCSAYVWWSRARTYGNAMIFWADADAIGGHVRKSFVAYGALLGNQSASPLSGDDVANGFLSQLANGLHAAAKGDDSSAKRAFSQASKLDPLSSWPQLFTADLDLAEGRADEARRRFIGIVRESWPHYAGPDLVAVEMLDAYPPAACMKTIHRSGHGL